MHLGEIWLKLNAFLELQPNETFNITVTTFHSLTYMDIYF